MKKVVSALTAAAMCASMAAGVMSVFAAYNSSDLGFYLKVVSDGNYTVSADGKTITFATAEDAKNATFAVAEYIKADTENPQVCVVSSMFETSDDAVGWVMDGEDPKVADITSSSYYDTAQEYTVNGTTFTTKNYVNCFGFLNKLGKYKSGCGAWVYVVNPQGYLGYTWTYSFDANVYDDYTETAHFFGDASDTFPLTQFEVELSEDITEGTYTIDFKPTYDHKDYGTIPASYVVCSDNAIVTPDSLEGLTIVVGDQEATTKETAATTEATEATTKETQEPTNSTVSDKNFTNFTYYVDDITAEPGDIVYLPVKVKNDPGIGGYTFFLMINGEEFSNGVASYFEVVDISQGVDGSEEGVAAYEFDTFMPNLALCGVAAANANTLGNMYGADGSTVFEVALQVADDAEDGVYEVSFNLNDYCVGDGEAIQLFPDLVSGSITIGSVDPTEATTEETTEATTEATTAPTEGTTATQDYLYGDVNKNGKVELVDIVMLNRYLTGYGNQTLDDYQQEVANCYYDKKLNGNDSIEILKYLIGLNESLPTAVK